MGAVVSAAKSLPLPTTRAPGCAAGKSGRAGGLWQVIGVQTVFGDSTVKQPLPGTDVSAMAARQASVSAASFGKDCAIADTEVRRTSATERQATSAAPHLRSKSAIVNNPSDQR